MFNVSTFADVIFGLVICHAAVVGGVVLQQRKFPVVDPGEIGRVLIIDGPKLLGLSVAQPHILSNDLFLLGSYILAQEVNEVIRIRLRRVARGRGFDRVLPGRRRILCQCQICREHDERQSDYKKFLLVHWDSSHVWRNLSWARMPRPVSTTRLFSKHGSNRAAPSTSRAAQDCTSPLAIRYP